MTVLRPGGQREGVGFRSWFVKEAEEKDPQTPLRSSGAWVTLSSFLRILPTNTSRLYCGGSFCDGWRERLAALLGST